MDTTEITPTEQEILNLVTDEFLTVKQIANRRQTTDKAVYKILSRLKKKGLMNIGLQKVENERGSIQPPNQIRIHAQQFLIKIIWKDHKYKKRLDRSNQIQIDGNTVDMYENSIYVSSNQSFYGDNLNHAFFKSSNYWPRFFARLEHETKCLLYKPRTQNIKLTRVHIAETNNELAVMVDNTGDRYFKVYADDDGKLRFLIDNSFNLHEFEGVRVRTARPDMERVGSVFNDIADKDHYLPSDTKSMIDGLVNASKNLIESQRQEFSLMQQVNDNTAWLAENIKSHGPAWFGMRDEMRKFRKIAEKQSQVSLKEFL